MEFLYGFCCLEQFVDFAGRYWCMRTELVYVWHDCFVYRSESCVIVFDYWLEPGVERVSYVADKPGDGELPLHRLIEECGGRPVYFLVSHHHKDHFVKDIFRWCAVRENVQYVISRDTARAVNYLLKEGSTYTGSLKVDRSRVHVLRPGERFEDSLIRVSAFGSTDIGNSYVVEVDGLRLFHAGDLNAWMWKDESTRAEVAAAIWDYEVKLKEIADHFPQVDYAMFPVDARIGRDWWEGAYRFVRRIDTGVFIPMHFCLYANDAERIDFIRKATSFALYADPKRGHYASMTEPWERLLL